MREELQAAQTNTVSLWASGAEKEIKSYNEEQTQIQDIVM